jgi:tetratricopeptide (TPR) repeat protein
LAAASFLGILIYTSFFIFRNDQGKNILALYKKPIYDANRSEIQDIKAKQDSAILYFELNRIDDAQALFLNIPPNDTTSFFMGHIRLQQKNYSQAIEYFSKVRKLSSYHENAKYHLVLLYLLINDKEKAKQLYRTLLNADDMKQLSPLFK